MVLSCLAVMSTYLEAREPDVILPARETVFAAGGGCIAGFSESTKTSCTSCWGIGGLLRDEATKDGR